MSHTQDLLSQAAEDHSEGGFAPLSNHLPGELRGQSPRAERLDSSAPECSAPGRPRPREGTSR
jgi:hypothetical protein